MDQLTPSLCGLLDLFSRCFRPEVAITFQFMVAAWIVCLGRRTISRVWETTGRSAEHSHCPAFRLFSEAAWNWDEVGRILLVKLLALGHVLLEIAAARTRECTERTSHPTVEEATHASAVNVPGVAARPARSKGPNSNAG